MVKKKGKTPTQRKRDGARFKLQKKKLEVLEKLTKTKEKRLEAALRKEKMLLAQRKKLRLLEKKIAMQKAALKKQRMVARKPVLTATQKAQLKVQAKKGLGFLRNVADRLEEVGEKL